MKDNLDGLPYPGTGPYSSAHCAYAIAILLRRLIDEGYVHEERKTELLDRAWNLQRGRGFLTNAELKAQLQAEELLS